MTSDSPRLPIFDGHNDTLLALHLPGDEPPRSFFERGERGHVDLPRAVEGGFAGGLFGIFVPPEPDLHSVMNAGPPPSVSYDLPLPPPVDHHYAKDLTIALVASLFRLEAESKGRLKVVRTAVELRQSIKEGVIAAVIHFEGAEAIDENLDALSVFQAAGLRSLGIVWSRPNVFATGTPFRFPALPDTGPGLTDAGKALVRACNELRVVVDLAHINEQGFWDVAALTDAPLVVSHTGVHALSPGTRNLTDRQLDAIAETNGIVGIGFHVGFLRADGGQDPDTPLTEIVRHIVYIAERIGVDHVGFGSDFDGCTVPLELGDVAGLPRLVEALRSHGFGESDLQKITHENWLRVLEETWEK
jgi:membrane dipeptidase